MPVIPSSVEISIRHPPALFLPLGEFASPIVLGSLCSNKVVFNPIILIIDLIHFFLLLLISLFKYLEIKPKKILSSKDELFSKNYNAQFCIFI